MGITASETRRFVYAVSWYMMEIQQRILSEEFPRHVEIEAEKTRFLALIKNDDPQSESILTPSNVGTTSCEGDT